MGTLRLAALASCVIATGCASIGNVQRADTLGRGNYQVGLEPGVQAIVTQAGAAPYPHLDASFRYGITDGIDLGLRGGWSFLEAQGKFLLTKPTDPKLAISLAPTVGGIAVGAAGATVGLLNFSVPLLIGLKGEPRQFSRLGGMVAGNELVIGPRLQGYYLFGSSAGSGSAGALVLAPGVTLGYAIQVSETLCILPELAIVVPAFATAGATSIPGQSGFGIGGALVQLKLGILIGKGRTVAEPDEDLTPPPLPER
ncbi:MAG: hypothetical protein INH41_21070 [Myxococcaceae bacterium]|jgi:hypothetical protein|nr:hypothetical protein [Myxococcaceae bacterium]